MSITIRILPMDKQNEFHGQDIESVQSDFFLMEVPSRVVKDVQGIYCFKTNKIKLDNQETYILFQYDNHIIACAKLDKIIQDKTHNEYGGYYVLPPDTIYTFDKISRENINRFIFPQEPIKRFSQVCHKKSLQSIELFLKNTDVVKDLQSVLQANITLQNNFQCTPRK